MTSYETTTSTRSAHRCAQGFCTVCGSAWPCWRGTVDDRSVATSHMTALSLGLPR